MSLFRLNFFYSNSSTITVGYGSGTVKGNLGQDIMSVAGLDVTFTFGQANEATSATSKEANKNVAKDSDVDLSTRATAAKDAVGDKIDESKNSVRLPTHI